MASSPITVSVPTLEHSSSHTSSAAAGLPPAVLRAHNNSGLTVNITPPSLSKRLSTSASAHSLSSAALQQPLTQPLEPADDTDDIELNEPLSAPPVPGPPPAPLLSSMAAISSRRPNAGQTVYSSGSQGFLTELMGRTADRKSENDEDEGRKRAQREREARQRRDSLKAAKAASLPQFECPRCHQRIYEFDRESHATSHSSEILPFLYLGGERNASNRVELTTRTSITHILNVAWEVANFFPEQFHYRNFSLSDYADQSIAEVLDEACAFIEEARLSGGRCLVHCVQGISRSASIVVAYLIASQELTANAALDFVRKRRSLVCPNPGFLIQLDQYGQLWQQRRSQGLTLTQLMSDRATTTRRNSTIAVAISETKPLNGTTMNGTNGVKAMDIDAGVRLTTA